jgi:hypothetical protein
MDAQNLLRCHQRTLPDGGVGNPRLFTVGTATPNPPNACLAASAFQGGLCNTQDGWARADAAHPEADLCADWTRQKRVVVVPGLHTGAHAVVFNDGSALLGQRVGRSLRLYPGVLWLRTKAYGWAFSVHMGGVDGPASLQMRSAKETVSTLLTGGDLAQAHTTPPNDDDPKARWAWALRTDIDRFDPAFDVLTEAHHVPAPGEGYAARPGYPLFLPRPGLDAPSLHAAKALVQTALDWVACAVAPSATDRLGLHPSPRYLGRHGAQGWTFGWIAGIQSRMQRAQWEPNDLATYFPEALAAALVDLGARDLGWRYANQNVARFETPLGAEAPRTPPSAHATVALLAAWGMPSGAQIDAWIQLMDTTP